ncbi:BTAD domain-containing putative transcriptional regulator [Solihabitans fulvus]|nr:LuxR C-terminal-related transcriptional regulator [Solihabitans fulvus]
MQFRVLGPLEAHRRHGVRIEVRAKKPAALLAVLLLNANAWVSVDQLIDAIWHEQAVPLSAVRNLRSYVCQLRRDLGDRLEGRPGGYRITVLPGELDTDEVRAHAEAARSALADGSPSAAAEHLADALALWRGAPFDGLGFATARTAVAALDVLRGELRGLLADAHLALGGPAGPRRAASDPGVDPAPAEHTAPVLGRPHPSPTAPDIDRRSPAVRALPTGQLTLVENTPTRGQAGIDALIASAVSDVLIMSSSAGAGRIGTFHRVDHDNLRRGVRYRVLFPDAARLTGALSSLSFAGAEVRTDVDIPMEAIVIDRAAVVLPSDRGSGVAVFRLPGVLTATTGLFERIWPAAVPLVPSDPTEAEDAAVLTRRERDLLALLCSGSTDESAGARLGISVRTVRRMVADIMNRLGARSRFQAGVKVADRGWLLDEAG